MVRLTCHFNKIIILVIKPICIVKVNVIAFNNMLYLHRLVLGLKLCQLCWLGSYIDFVTDDVVLVFTLTVTDVGVYIDFVTDGVVLVFTLTLLQMVMS